MRSPVELRVTGSQSRVGKSSGIVVVPAWYISQGKIAVANSGRYRSCLLYTSRPGDTVGYYIPARHKRVETERAALKEAASRLQQVLAAEGISEDEILADFKR